MRLAILVDVIAIAAGIAIILPAIDARSQDTAEDCAGDRALDRADTGDDRPDRSAGYITLSVLLISTLAATVAVGLLLTPRPTLGRSLIGLQMVEVEALLDSGLDLAAYRLFAQDGAAEPWRLTPEPVALKSVQRTPPLSNRLGVSVTVSNR